MKKTVIVTGAAGNLGRAVVEKFFNENYDVTGIVRRLPESDKKLEGKTVALELLDAGACNNFIEDYTKENTINVAVLTAGGFTMGDIAATETPDIYKQYQLNFETAYNIARPLFLYMMQQGEGLIFMTGSQAGLNANVAKGSTAYSLSKSLLFRLAEIMNAEAKGTNVRVKIIVPSIIDTPQNREAMPAADHSKWKKPSEIAGIIYHHTIGEERLAKDHFILMS